MWDFNSSYNCNNNYGFLHDQHPLGLFQQSYGQIKNLTLRSLFIYIYIYMYMCVCIGICMYVEREGVKP